MTTKPRRTHYARETSGDVVFGQCNALATFWTRERDAVNCARCKARLKTIDALPFVVEPTPWTPPPPERAEPGQRDLDAIATRAIAESKAGERSGPTFHSLDDALKRYAAVRHDGYASGSASAGHEALATHGCRVQSEGRKVSSTTKQAEGVAEVSRCLSYALNLWAAAFPTTAKDAGALCELTPAKVETLFLLMEVGKPLRDRAKRKAGKREYVPKGGVRSWTPMTPDDIAEETALTAKDARKLRKWCKQHTEAEMMYRGLLREPGRPRSEDPERQASRERHWLWRQDYIEARRQQREVA